MAELKRELTHSEHHDTEIEIRWLNEDDMVKAGVLSVMGCGKQCGYISEMHFTGEDINLLPKIMVFTVVEDRQCEDILADINSAIGTGKTGDGKVFVTNIEDAMRIRTNERGVDALR